jgi:hypothetical protein
MSSVNLDTADGRAGPVRVSSLALMEERGRVVLGDLDNDIRQAPRLEDLAL